MWQEEREALYVARVHQLQRSQQRLCWQQRCVVVTSRASPEPCGLVMHSEDPAAVASLLGQQLAWRGTMHAAQHM